MRNRPGFSIATAVFSGILLFALLIGGSPLPAQEKFPRPQGAVNDYAGVISQEHAKRMENLSREVLEKTGTSIVVAVVQTIGENEINGYANDLYRAWGIGKKGKDKGVLILLAMKEKRIRIETGYGVEGILPDGLTGEILDKNIVPFLKNGDYGRGLFNGMIAIASVVAKDAGVTLSGSPTAEVPRAKRTKKSISPYMVVLIIIVAIILMATPQGRDMIPWLLFFVMSGGRGGGGSGDGFGGFGGGFGGFGGGDSGGGGAGRDF